MFDSVMNSLSNFHIDKVNICYLHQNELKKISDPYIHDGLRLLKDRV